MSRYSTGASRALLWAAASGLMLLTTACGTLRSQPTATTLAGGGLPGGQTYYLPETEFAVSVTIGAEDVAIGVKERYVADTAAGQLTLVTSPGLFSSDNPHVTVNDQHLLTSAAVTYDSAAPEIFKVIGEIAGRLEANLTEGGVVDHFDPADDTQRNAAAARLSRALAGSARAELDRIDVAARIEAAAAPSGKADEKPETARRKAFLTRLTTTGLALDWEWANTSETMARSGSAACGTGVCVRAPRPGRLRIYRCDNVAAGACTAANGIFVGAHTADIPNGARSTPVPIQGGVFADVTHTLTLSNGMLTDYQLTRGNEFQGLTTSAGNLVVGFFSGVAQGATDEKSRIEAETLRLEAETKRLKAEQDLATARAAETQTGGTEAALLQAPSSHAARLFGGGEAASEARILTTVTEATNGRQDQGAAAAGAAGAAVQGPGQAGPVADQDNARPAQSTSGSPGALGAGTKPPGQS